MLKQLEHNSKNNCFSSSELNGNLQSSDFYSQKNSQVQEIRFNSVRSFKTNKNPFTQKKNIKPPQSDCKIQNQFRTQQQQQKPSFCKILNKQIDIEESLFASLEKSRLNNIDETYQQIMQSGSADNQDSIQHRLIEQEVIINKDNRFNLNINQQNYSSDSSSDTETSSCVQWEEVMQNRNNLINILQEILFDSNENIQPIKKNNSLQKFNIIQESQPNSFGQINKLKNESNLKQEIQTLYNQPKEGLKKQNNQQASPLSDRMSKNEIESIDNKLQLEEVVDEYLDEKESLYFIKKQNRHSIFGSIQSNSAQKNIQLGNTKTTMNTINLSTMTTINQTFSPQINKRNSKCIISQQINLN